TSHFPKGDKHTEVILTGSFLMRLIELPYWKLQEMRLWTFSSKLKKTLSEFLDINPNLIGLIPHPNHSKKELDLKSADLIYVGRLNWTKNIEALLCLTSYIQHHYSSEITLSLVGKPDDLPDESLGRVETLPFEMELQKIINHLPWVNPPKLYGHQDNWKGFLNDKSHFISLSTSMYEDFGVAANEAGEKVPTLLSSWGGHWDQSGAYLIPSEHIFHSYEAEWIKKRKTELLAQSMTQGIFYEAEEMTPYIPVMSHHKELTEACLKFIDRHSPEILLLFREDLDTFADTDKGKTLFHRYRNHFSERFSSLRTLHIYGEEAQDYPFSKEAFLIPERELIYNVYQKLLFRDFEIEINGISSKVLDFLTDTLNISDIKNVASLDKEI